MMTPAHPEANPHSARIRTSTDQYAPWFLLYSDARWGTVRTEDLIREVGLAMPAEPRSGWEALATGPPPSDSPEEGRAQWEREASPAARWIADQGATIGIRTPNVWERARATDLEEFYRDMRGCGLDEPALFTAQGNAFDHIAASLRLSQALRAWSQGGEIRRHQFPPPGRAEELYQQLRRVLSAGEDGGPRVECAESTIPRDLQPVLLPIEGGHLRQPFCSSRLWQQRAIAAPADGSAGHLSLPAAGAGRGAQ